MLSNVPAVLKAAEQLDRTARHKVLRQRWTHERSGTLYKQSKRAVCEKVQQLKQVARHNQSFEHCNEQKYTVFLDPAQSDWDKTTRTCLHGAQRLERESFSTPIKEPQTFWHVPQTGGFSPKAKVGAEVEEASKDGHGAVCLVAATLQV